MLNIYELKKYPIIYIIGHRRTDADSAISSYLLSKILNKLGVKCEYAVLDKNYDIVYDDYDLIKDNIEYKPTIIKESEIDNKHFILVDHNNPIQSINNDKNVVGIIDHHFSNENNSNCLIGNYASNSLFIYQLYKGIYDFSDYEKELILYTVLSDTAYFRTSRYKEMDAKLVQELNEKINLDFDLLRKKYFRTTDFNKDVETNFNEAYKKYKFDDLEFGSSFVRASREDIKYLKEYLEYLNKVLSNWLFIWYQYDDKESKTFAYFKNNNVIKEFNYNYIASRANTIVKDILESEKNIGNKKM